jgi:hypothetical protein
VGFSGPDVGHGIVPPELESHSRDYSRFDGAAELLCGAATADAESGKMDEALSELAAAERFSNLAGKNPNVIGGLIAFSTEGRVLAIFKKLMKAHPEDRTILAGVSHILGGLKPQPNLERALEWEFVYAVAVTRAREPRTENESISSRLKRSLYQTPIENHAMAQRIHGYRIYLEHMPKDPTDYDGIKSAFEYAAKFTEPDWETRESVTSSSASDDKDSEDRNPMRDESEVCDNWTWNLTKRRMIRDECRLLQIRLAKGQLPSKLPDFGQDRIDPFSHRPLVYRLKGDGFILYSWGPNRRDDGGVRGKKPGEGDLVDTY